MDITRRDYIYIIILLFMCILTYNRNSVWRNEYSLWKDVVNKTKNKAMPHINLGNAFMRRGLLDNAEREFGDALKVNPRDIRAISGLATLYLERAEYDKAISIFEILVKDKPQEATFHNNLGVAYMNKGFLDNAIKEFEAAVDIRPDFQVYRSNLDMANKKKSENRPNILN